MKSFSEQQTQESTDLELMARGGMRIGEVLKLTLDDIRGPKAVVARTKIRQGA
jgi:integrase